MGLDLDAKRSKNNYTISHVYQMVISPDGKTIAISYDQSSVVSDVLQSDRKGSVALIDAGTGKLTKSLIDNRANITFSPDGGVLVTVGSDSIVRFWNTVGGNEIREIKVDFVGTPLFVPSGRLLAVANRLEWSSKDPMVKVYDLKDGSVVRSFPKEYVEITGISISHDGKKLAIGGFNGGVYTIKIWELDKTNEPEPASLISKDEKIGSNVVFSPDDSTLASSGFMKSRPVVVVRTVSTNVVKKTLWPAHDVKSLAYAPDGKHLAIGTAEGEIFLMPIEK
jgi:WD40 repeat protein